MCVLGGRECQGLPTGPDPWEKPGLATLKPWVGGWVRELRQNRDDLRPGHGSHWLKRWGTGGEGAWGPEPEQEASEGRGRREGSLRPAGDPG